MVLQLVSLIVFSIVLTGCIASPCGNVVLQEVVAPEGQHIATLFERNCGATTPFARAVVIRNSNKRFDGDDVDSYVFTMSGRHDIELHWQDARHLVIVRPFIPKDIFKTLGMWSGTQVSYENQ